MIFHKESLDLVLVPSGFILMIGYHLWLLYRSHYHPRTTVVGFENHDKKAWVDKIMKMDKSNIMIPLTVLSVNIQLATFFGSVSLTLCALIGAWMANNTIFQSDLVYGDKHPSIMCIKFISLLICFLLAFSSFVQSMRSFLHATYLMSLPDSDDLPMMTKYMELAVIRGGHFWHLGLRALYFALCLLLWFLGPIPMFVTSVGMVLFLHFLDNNTTPVLPHSSTTTESEREATRKFMNGGATDVEHIGS